MFGECIVVLQISDIHFGKFHCTDKNKESLSESFLTLLARLDDNLKPHFIIINGDLTSMSLDSEFKKAIEFIGKLKKIGLRKNETTYSLSQRILLVPGNHDTRWLSKLKTDNLSRFRSYMKKRNLCITSFCSGRVTNVTQINNNGECEVPCSIYYYENYEIIFLLLTSSYYSGKVSDKEAIKVMKDVYAVMERIKDGNEKFKLLAEIIRVDSGYISEEYIRSIISTIDRLKNKIGEIKYKAAVKIVLTHHPLSSVAQETAVCSKAGNLLESIKERGFSIVTHGHCHTAGLYNDTPHVRKAKCIPVTTLSGSDQFSGLGFNVLAFDKNHRSCKVYEWKLSDDGNYKLDKNALNLKGEIKL
jgi:3',5'-cyclic AMP phosphodiesterase CpdA